jgi:copper chaperone
MLGMATTVISVSGMTCSHCVHAVQDEIGRLPGVTDVKVDLDTGAVTVTAEPMPGADALSEAVDEAGYQIA